jgi:hypothetical protein
VIVSGIVVAVLLTIGMLASRGPDDAAARKHGGCPNGTQAFTHVCIETSSRATNQGFDDAVATCAALKRRLPTSAELDAFRQQDGITLGGAEFTSDFLDDTAHVLGIDDNGGRALIQTAPDINVVFRCVS